MNCKTMLLNPQGGMPHHQVAVLQKQRGEFPAADYQRSNGSIDRI